LVVWSACDDRAEPCNDVLGIWRTWPVDIRGAVIDSGHHMAQQAPERLAGELAALLALR
jgi:haloacetate dehalogenase